MIAGDTLAPLTVPLTRTLIVATAIASRDYQDVHHDPDLARARGARDIFMNILTSNALVERYVRAWAGPACVVERIRIRLGVPNHPGDAMTLTGVVGTVEDDRVEVQVEGRNSLGVHLSGAVHVRLSQGS